MFVIDEIEAVNGVEGTFTMHERDAGAEKAKKKLDFINPHPLPLSAQVKEALYSESVSAKIWGVALRGLRGSAPPTRFPEYTLPKGREYVSSSADFWTSGFFPGCLHLIYQRQTKWPVSISSMPHPTKLKFAMKWWTDALHPQSLRQDTHDLGFMIQPWAKIGWELNADPQCFHSLVNAAHSLASRFDSKVGCIRSWDVCVTKRYSFLDPTKNFLVIIDNLMNLDLLYYVAKLTGEHELAKIATTHALTSMHAHIRVDGGTCHVVDFDPATGKVRARLTNQGYNDHSCWSRGQAWGIAGFAQVYHRTKDERFLDASKRLANYFMNRLSADSVPYWDFDAPTPAPKDTSAALVAVYGLLLIHEAEAGSGYVGSPTPYLVYALQILSAVVSNSLAAPAKFVTTSSDEEVVDLGDDVETIIMHATINNYEYAPRRWADHGLVYADYFFLLVGNKLLEMGLA